MAPTRLQCQCCHRGCPARRWTGAGGTQLPGWLHGRASTGCLNGRKWRKQVRLRCPAVHGLAMMWGHPLPPPQAPAALLTFKEDKSPVVPLVGSVDVPRQSPPEVPDGHGVVVQHPIVPDPPEPLALVGSKASAQHGDTQRQSPGGGQSAGAPLPPRDPGVDMGSEGRGGVLIGTLNTNISPRSTATVSKFPSQMSGPYWSGRSGLPGFGGRSGFPGGGGLGGLWSGLPGLRGVTVGKGLVG